MLGRLAWWWLALAGPPPSHPELELLWDAPPACPDATRVRARVEGLLGRPLGEAESTLHVTARVHERDGWHLELTTRTPDGSRTRPFTGQSCEVLAETAILAIAIAIDPTVTGRALATEPEQAAEPEPTAPTPSPAPPEPVTAPPKPAAPLEPTPVEPAPPPVRFAGRVTAGATFGLLPATGPSLGAVAGVLVKWARVELHYTHHVERERLDGLRSVAVRLWTLGVRGCGAPTVARIVEIPACLGVQAGPMRGRSLQLSPPGRTSLPFVALDAGAGVAVFPVAWLGVAVGGDLVVPVTRPGFVIDDIGVVDRAGSVGGRVWAGLEVRLALPRRSAKGGSA